MWCVPCPGRDQPVPPQCPLVEQLPGRALGSDSPRPPWTGCVASGMCGTFLNLHSLVCQAEIWAVTVLPCPQLGQGLRDRSWPQGPARGSSQLSHSSLRRVVGPRCTSAYGPRLVESPRGWQGGCWTSPRREVLCKGRSATSDSREPAAGLEVTGGGRMASSGYLPADRLCHWPLLMSAPLHPS